MYFLKTPLAMLLEKKFHKINQKKIFIKLHHEGMKFKKVPLTQQEITY